MRNILVLIFVPALFSCGTTKTAKSDITMGKKIADSLEIVIRIENCISLKDENVLSFYLKNNSHSHLTIHTGNIVPGSISDSSGHKLMPINRIEYATIVNDIIELEPGAEKEVSYKTRYFSNFDLKTGQLYYLSAGYISTGNEDSDLKGSLAKFYLCNE